MYVNTFTCFFPDPATLAVAVCKQDGKTIIDIPPQIVEYVYDISDLPSDVIVKIKLTADLWWKHAQKARQDIEDTDFRVKLGLEVSVCVCVTVCHGVCVHNAVSVSVTV